MIDGRSPSVMLAKANSQRGRANEESAHHVDPFAASQVHFIPGNRSGQRLVRVDHEKRRAIPTSQRRDCGGVGAQRDGSVGQYGGLAYLKLATLCADRRDRFLEPVKQGMPEHVRGNHVLWRNGQNVERDALRIRLRKSIKALRKGLQVFLGIRLQQCVVVALDDLPEAKPFHQIVRCCRIFTEELGGLTPVIRQRFLENLPTVFRLRVGKTKCHVCIGFAVYVRHTQCVALDFSTIGVSGS